YAGDFPVLLPLEEALRGGALLARRRNGTPLTRDHGAPLRQVAPGRASRVWWADRLGGLAEGAPTTRETTARSRVQREGGRTRPRSEGVGQGVMGHEQGALCSCRWSRKERTDDERDHSADSR